MKLFFWGFFGLCECIILSVMRKIFKIKVVIMEIRVVLFGYLFLFSLFVDGVGVFFCFFGFLL